MEINTINGFAIVDDEQIILGDYREHSGNDKFCEIHLMMHNGFIHVLQMRSKEDAYKYLEVIASIIENRNVMVDNLDGNESKRPDYITGFKEGTEYALKLKSGE